MAPELVAINATGVAPRPKVKGRTPIILVIGGVGLLIAGIVSLAVIAALQVGGYPWSDDVQVPLDGESHTVAVDADRAALIWRFGSLSNPNCVVRDAATQTELPVTWTDQSYVRGGGMSDVDYVAVLSFTPTSDLVEVTCPGLEGARTFVAVEPAPALPPVLAAYGSAVAIPIGLAFAGLAALVWAAIAALAGRRRHAG